MKPLLLLVAAITVSHPAFAQDTWPDAPGKKETLQVCSTCHEAAKATSVKSALSRGLARLRETTINDDQALG